MSMTPAALDRFDRHRRAQLLRRRRRRRRPARRAGRPSWRGLIGRVDELGLLCVPDLTWSCDRTGSPVPTRPTARLPPAASGPAWPIRRRPARRPTAAHRRSWTPAMPDELAEIIRRQLRLADVAALQHRFVALLDVPSGLPVGEIARWRARFDSSYAAAYHPWLGVPATSPGCAAVSVPPSAFAAGIIAARDSARPALGPGERARGRRGHRRPTSSPPRCTTSCTCSGSTSSAPSATGSGSRPRARCRPTRATASSACAG